MKLRNEAPVGPSMMRDQLAARSFSQAVDWAKMRASLGRSRRIRPPVPPKPAKLCGQDGAQARQLQRPMPNTGLLAVVPESHLTRRLQLNPRLTAPSRYVGTHALAELPSLPSLAFEVLSRPKPTEQPVPEHAIPEAPPLPTTSSRTLRRQGSLPKRRPSPRPADRRSALQREPERPATPPPAPPLPPPLDPRARGSGLRRIEEVAGAEGGTGSTTLHARLRGVILRHVQHAKKLQRRRSLDLREQIQAVQLRKASTTQEQAARLGPHNVHLMSHANHHFARAGLPELDVTDRMGASTDSNGWRIADDAFLEVELARAGGQVDHGVHGVGHTSFAPGDATAKAYYHGENPFGEYSWFDVDSHASRAEGRIVVVYSGGCSLLQKVQNAQQAGALGLVVISQFAFLDPPALCIPKDFDLVRSVNEIPVVSVAKEVGQSIVDGWDPDAVTLHLHVEPSFSRAVGLGRLDLVDALLDSVGPATPEAASGPQEAGDDGAPGGDALPGAGEGGWAAGADLPPLWQAASLGETAILSRLIEVGCPLDVRGPNGTTPLMAAVLSNATDACVELVRAGAAVNAVTESGETVLHLAMKAGLDDIVMELLRAGVDTTATDYLGNTALSWACDRGHADMIRFLLECDDGVELNIDAAILSAKGRVRSETLLYKATRLQHHAVVKLLLEFGADPNLSVSGVQRPVHIAVHLNDLALVQLLLDSGADVTACVSAQGWSPLHLAVRNRNTELVALLLDHGADPDVKGFNTGVTPCFLAVYQGSVAILRALLAAECNPNLANHQGISPVMVTIRQGSFHRECFDALVESGADLDCVAHESGLAPLHWAISRSRPLVVDLLLERSCCVNARTTEGIMPTGLTPLHLSITHGHLDLFHRLLAAGADPNLCDEEGDSPLSYVVAAWSGKYPPADRQAMAAALIQRGADIAVTSSEGVSLTDAIFGLEGKEVAERILAPYDQRLQVDEEGNTPLHRAAMIPSEVLWSLLVSQGANAMALNNNGKRPLDLVTDADLQFKFKRLVGKRDVMISYSHRDQAFAQRLRAFLEERKITTWMDLTDPTGIAGGSVWRDEIGDAIREATAMIAILSDTYQRSSWCMKELELAKQYRTEVFPVTIRNFKLDANLKMTVFAKQIVCFEGSFDAFKKRNTPKFTKHGLAVVDGLRDCIERRRKASKSGAKWRRLMGLLRSTSEEASATELWKGLGPSLPVPPDYNAFAFVAHGDCHPEHVCEIMEELGMSIKCIAPNPTARTSQADIIKAIKDCKVFVPLLSTSSCLSDSLRDQMAFAEDIDKAIVPVFLGELSMPAGFAYQLAQSRGVSFSLHRAVRSQHGMAALTKVLEDSIQPAAPPPLPPPPPVRCASPPAIASTAPAARLAAAAPYAPAPQRAGPQDLQAQLAEAHRRIAELEAANLRLTTAAAAAAARNATPAAPSRHNAQL